MEPKELAKFYEQKTKDNATKAAEKRAYSERQQEAFQKRVEEGRAAVRDVVIPYLKKVTSAFAKGQFKFNPAALTDAQTHEPVAVSFKIGDGAEHVIEVINGAVRIYRKGPQVPQRGPVAPAFPNVQFVYASNAEPYIAEPRDLTEEKLCKLVEIAIKTE